MRAELLSVWMVNFLTVAVFPVMLGRSGIPTGVFALYVAAVGLALLLIENASYLPRLISRPDIRAYLHVRVAMIGVLAISPFLAGRLLAA